MHQQVMASIDFSQGLSDAWSSIARFIPKSVGFAADSG
jgi:hypothetical protein